MMHKLIKRSTKVGLPPGELVYVGEQKDRKVKITVIDYDEQNVVEKEIQNVEECFPFKEKASITWINIDGIERLDIIEKIDAHFGIHPLVLEDIVNTEQRPKMDEYADYLFIVLKMLYMDRKTDKIIAEQISLIVGTNYVISFQDSDMEGDIFDLVRERIRSGKGRIRKMGADYLAYSLIDTIVDHYFIILEELSTEIEVIEQELMADASLITLKEIHLIKRDVISLRKYIWPLREVINNVQRAESKLIKKSTGVYFRDVYDHTIQVIDSVETFRDIITSMLEIYLSSLSNRLNEIMKVLTIITTIFIPLSFIASIYGMNFRHMPELEWRWGYHVVVAFMLFIGLLMVHYFKRKKWI